MSGKRPPSHPGKAVLAALRKKGIAIDTSGRPRKRGAFLSTAAFLRAVQRARRTAASRRPSTRKRPTRPAKPGKPTPRRTSAAKPRRPPPAPATTAPRAPKIRRPSREQLAALATLPPAIRKAAVAAIQKASTSAKPTKAEKRAEKQLQKIEGERRRVKTAKDELARAVQAAARNSGRAYGYDPRTRHHYKMKGVFGGYRVTPFDRRAGHIQEVLRKKFPADFRRDLHVQAVHVREYMTQGDGGAGRRAIAEKVLNAGRKCIAERLVDKKTGKPLRVHQMYIGRIRILVRKEDAGMYGGYSTRPIDGKRSRAVTDIRGLEGFEQVSRGEDPRVALDRLVERLENHLDDILDGLPVVYVKSLEIKFDTEAQ